jgi:hypothetical protein
MPDMRNQDQASGENDGGGSEGDAFRAKVESRSRFVPLRTGRIRVTIARGIVIFAVLFSTSSAGWGFSQTDRDRSLVKVSIVAAARFEAGATETGLDGDADHASSSGSSTYRIPRGSSPGTSGEVGGGND